MYPGRLYLMKEKAFKRMKAIVERKGGPQCVRCGNHFSHLFGKIDCLNCKKECLYCRNCLVLGQIKSCSFLYYQLPSPLKPCVKRYLYWNGRFSKGQEKGAQAVVQAIHDNQSLLLWAVAGSGKTEMLFQAIELALQKGKRICLASPRVDVCMELFPRIKAVFPKIPIICLYGGAKDRFSGERFVIATTHQLMHFYQYFDVIFIDEVDAFPYAKDPSLEYTVKKALTNHAAEIYITATPEYAWQKECKQGRRNYVKIPARYHRHFLPVPRFVWVGNYQKQLKKGRLPVKLLAWMQNVVAKKQIALIFFPEIKIMNRFYTILNREHLFSIASVHAADPCRKDKVAQLKEKIIDILLTTTILERGVTFKNVQVAVLGSEERIFTEAALVQIAGRAGRHADMPTGDVCFFHHGLSTEMKRAVSHIRHMNKLGLKEGLLDA